MNINEDHLIAAILSAGMLAANRENNIEPRDAVTLYSLTLSELLAANRAPREDEA